MRLRAVLRLTTLKHPLGRFVGTETSSAGKPANTADPNVRQQETERRDISLVGHSMGYFFNTHTAVKNLQKYGFKLEEAEALTELLTQIVLAQTDSHFKNFVNKPQLEISVQQLLAQIDAVKKDMAILDKSQFAQLRHDQEKISMAVKQLDNKLLDEMMKLKGGVALDMNLEKSRAKDDVHKLAFDIQMLTNRIDVQAANLKTEVANVRVYTESSRNDMMKYLWGAVAGLVGTGTGVAFLITRIFSK